MSAFVRHGRPLRVGYGLSLPCDERLLRRETGRSVRARQLALSARSNGTEMPQIKNASGIEEVARVVLIIYTIVVSWAFIHSMFALHYVHDYYLNVDVSPAPLGPTSERLIFPGEHSPTYGDFLYFSFTIGMTFQVSDVQIADSAIRRVALAHGAFAFFYTTGILALTINLVAGLI